MERKHSIPPVKRKFKSQPVVGEGMLTLFQDLQGPSLRHYQKRGVMNRECYCEMLHNRLKLAIQVKYQGQLSKAVFFLMAHISFCNDGPSVLESRRAVLKNHALVELYCCYVNFNIHIANTFRFALVVATFF
jgi:hypothetical protein